jgi:hypothetical protein
MAYWRRFVSGSYFDNHTELSLRKVDALEKLSPASGTFVNYDGSTLPW